MVTIKRYKKLIKAAGCGVVLLGGIWVCYQIRQTYLNINQLLKVDILEFERKRAEYIYINHPHFKDRTSLVLTEGENQQESTAVFDMPMRWWKSWKHSYAWRLLSMACNGDRYDHLKAVHSLASLNSLSDSDCRQLAQVCDKRTAIGLARSERVDLRFFLAPPFAHNVPNKQQLTASLQMFLEALNKEKNHLCIQYFLRKAFPNFHQKHFSLEDLTSTEVHQIPVSKEDILPQCIENLLHHSTIDDNAKDIVKFGGLPILMDCCKYFKDNTEVLANLGKVISNISLYPELLHDIFISGWVGVLAKWAQHPDVQLSAPAVRALANLDEDDYLRDVYGQSVYLLHPASRKWEKPKLDVVFVHGLLGGAFITWRQRDQYCDIDSSVSEWDPVVEEVSDEKTKEYIKNVTEMRKQEWSELLREYEFVLDDCPVFSSETASGPFSYTGQHRIYTKHDAEKKCYTKCWPKDWLPNDCRHLRVIGINYDTSISEWAILCPSQKAKRSLEERSDELLEKLKLAGVGSRPVLWVGHSMGGLLIKNILVKAWKSGDKAAEQMCTQTRAITFYSVPHMGTPLAAVRQVTSLLLWPSVEVQELRENSPTLLSLNESFLRMLDEVPMKVISFAETKPTIVSTVPPLQYIFVPLSSADIGVGEFFAIPQDHLSMCKPASRYSFLYQKVLQLIHECTPTSET